MLRRRWHVLCLEAGYSIQPRVLTWVHLKSGFRRKRVADRRRRNGHIMGGDPVQLRVDRRTLAPVKSASNLHPPLPLADPYFNSTVASMVGSGGVTDFFLVSFFDLRKSCPAPRLFVMCQALMPQGQQPRFYTYISWSRGSPGCRFGVRRSVPSPKIVTRYRRPPNHVYPLRRVIFSNGSQSLIVALDRPGSQVRGILGRVCD